MKKVIGTGFSKGLGKVIKNVLESVCEPGFGGHGEQKYLVHDFSRTSGVDLMRGSYTDGKYFNFATWLSQHEKMDILILNAGIWEGRAIEVYEFNYKIPKLMANMFLSHNKEGHLIFILSNAAYQNFGNDDYSTAKAGLLLYARRKQKEGFKVSTISPGTLNNENFWKNSEIDNRKSGSMESSVIAELVYSVIKSAELGALVTELIVLPVKKGKINDK